MPQLTATLTRSRPDVFGREIAARLKFLAQAEAAARQKAATTATATTRSRFRYKRDIAPPRSGRSSTGGQMGSYLTWKPVPDGVEFDITTARKRAPHWIIQEIGTGERARMRRGGEKLPQGRPRNGAAYIATVRPQKGRIIKGGLVFATKGGKYTPTSRGISTQQIQRASDVNAPQGAPRIRINKEIEGQHMVQAGGRTGFRQYETNVLAAARRAFKK